MGIRLIFLLTVISLVIFSACTSTKNIAYFKDSRDTTFDITIDTTEAPIQRNDILHITISSLNKTASSDFNANDNFVKGYLVDLDGNIQLPTLGNIAAAGITKSQLKKNITNTILEKGLLLDPLVEIRQLNFEVTVLGEVNRPTVITVPSEQITLVKALGLAGDLTIYGKRDNVLLIREEKGRRTTVHINLNSVEFLNSPYYNLKANDLIYVEPNKSKVASSDKAIIVLPILLSSISIILIAIATFKN
jgi:polysaccharide biosynthesis/export protein